MQAVGVQVAVGVHVVEDNDLLALRPDAEADRTVLVVLRRRPSTIGWKVRLASLLNVAHVHEDCKQAVVHSVRSHLHRSFVLLVVLRIEVVCVGGVPASVRVLQNLSVLRVHDRYASQVLHPLIQSLQNAVPGRRQEVIFGGPPVVHRLAVVRILEHYARLLNVRPSLLQHAIALALLDEGLDLENPRLQRERPQLDFVRASVDKAVQWSLEANLDRRPMPSPTFHQNQHLAVRGHANVFQHPIQRQPPAAGRKQRRLRGPRPRSSARLHPREHRVHGLPEGRIASDLHAVTANFCIQAVRKDAEALEGGSVGRSRPSHGTEHVEAPDLDLRQQDRNRAT
mmetsp:Transcript_35611/g.113804  ORF Transcript_35611/g.113804 Transcript_35611/m.113804 type:complete len:340 (+) Transcript_35611:300-1319(+)